MATKYTKEWVKFFTDCGLPDDVATVYALIFFENRIQKDMLLDLNKEYLRDMGITVMGDVIAILRNAKLVHEKSYREQILADNDSVEVKQNLDINFKKPTPTKRILEHFTKKYGSLNIESPKDVQVIVENEKITPIKMSLQNSSTKTPITAAKKIEVSITNPIKKEATQLGSLKVNTVALTNKEENKIKIMAKTSEKSKKLIEQAKKRQAKTVFDRLGESSVTSTTSEFINNNPVSNYSSDMIKDKNSSVFSRLGEKASLVSSTSSNNCDSQYNSKNKLPYAGIFKYGKVTKKNISNTATMRADDEQKKSANKTSFNKPASIKRRLGTEKRIEEGQMAINTTKRQKITFSADEKQFQPKIIKLKKDSQIGLSEQIKKTKMGQSKLLTEQIELRQKNAIVSSTTKLQFPISKANVSKLNMDSVETDSVSPSKKVTFGRTTHRLIPSTTMPAESTSNIKNYPNLTMIINNNNAKTRENSFGVGNAKKGSLSSDKISEKISISERIGKKGIEMRLKKRPFGSTFSTALPPSKKFCSIIDRLG